jgi:hypothetical protein
MGATAALAGTHRPGYLLTVPRNHNVVTSLAIGARELPVHRRASPEPGTGPTPATALRPRDYEWRGR